jgi:hypothetical protein
MVMQTPYGVNKRKNPAQGKAIARQICGKLKQKADPLRIIFVKIQKA